MIKGSMFYVAGYDEPIEIASRMEEDKTDYVYKDGELVATIVNDDIKLLKVLQKIVEEMKRKDKRMEIHRDEIKRYADSPDGTKVWSKSDGGIWATTITPAWNKNYIYIVDDMYAELRKESIDTSRPIQTFNFVSGWVTIKDASELTGTLSSYRVKPIAKDKVASAVVGDRLYSIEDGWGTVTDIVDGEYPLCLKFGLKRATFTLDGKRHTHSKNPILFRKKVKTKKQKKLKEPNKSSKSGKPLPDLTLDTAVLVWDVNGEKKLRRHFRKFNKQGRIVCFADGKTSYTIGKGMRMSWRYWELVK